MQRGTELRLILLLLGISLVLRLAFVLRLPDDEESLTRLPDQVEYIEIGRNLLAERGMQFFDHRFGESVFAYRMPGYPIFTALCGGDLRTVRIVQSMIDMLSVLAVYLLARRWLSGGGSLIAAGIVAFNPFLIYFCGLILSETLFTAMLIWGMLLFSRLRGWWGGAGLLALSVLVRPSAIALPVVLALGSGWLHHKVLLRAVATVGLMVLVMFPWAWRNHAVLGRWVWTTTAAGASLYDGLNPAATGASDQSMLAAMPELRSMNEVERSEHLRQLAVEFVKTNPAKVLKLAIIKAGRTLSPIPLSAEYGSNRGLVGVALSYMLPFDLFVLVGLLRRNLAQSLKVYLLLPLLYFTIVHAVFVGSLRYRIPSDVPIAIVAAFGTAGLRKDSQRDSLTEQP